MFVRAYLRASTVEQDANRARSVLEAFASERGLTIAATYVENESGAKLARPELFRLLADSRPGDVLLIEQVDRLSRLTSSEWDKLKAELATRRVRVVALDLPTSWTMADPNADQFTARMFDAINAMLLDMLAAVARKDYDDRRRRQTQGIQTAKAKGKYKGRPEDTDRNNALIAMLKNQMPWSQIVQATGCSRSTLARLAKRINGSPVEVEDAVNTGDPLDSPIVWPVPFEALETDPALFDSQEGVARERGHVVG